MFCCDAPKACCIPLSPRGGREDTSYDGCQPKIRIPRKVLKGEVTSVCGKLLPPLPPGRASS